MSKLENASILMINRLTTEQKDADPDDLAESAASMEATSAVLSQVRDQITKQLELNHQMDMRCADTGKWKGKASDL